MLGQEMMVYQIVLWNIKFKLKRKIISSFAVALWQAAGVLTFHHVSHAIPCWCGPLALPMPAAIRTAPHLSPLACAV